MSINHGKKCCMKGTESDSHTGCGNTDWFTVATDDTFLKIKFSALKTINTAIRTPQHCIPLRNE